MIDGEYRVLITGSRSWKSAAAISLVLDKACEEAASLGATRVVMINGMCPSGADQLAYEYWTEVLGLPVEEHPADWKRHGRAAGFIRNKAMVDSGADVCLAFSLNESKGTAHCMGLAVKAGIPVILTEANNA